MKVYGKLIVLLIVIEVILSLFIASSSNGFACAPGSSCGTVQNSIYGVIFGMKVAWFGAIAFSLLFLIYFIFANLGNKYWIFLVFSSIGMLFSLYFIALQFFVLKELCTNCLAVDSIMVIIFVLSVVEFMSRNQVP